MASMHSFPKEKVKIVLTEKIDPAARETFEEAGYAVTEFAGALEGTKLIDALSDAHVVGVRSRTLIKGEHLEHAKRLLMIGCFTVGTDQVQLDEARSFGIPVFNAPHSSTRSVAELALGSMLALARRVADKSARMHQGVWDKSAAGSFELRNKTLGIVGYGHIGQQLGLLAEAIGMNVVFYDIIKKLPLGRAMPVSSLDKILERAEFISLHVPSTKATELMMGAAQFEKMRPGSYLLNLSRGKVVDLEALRTHLLSGHLGGAALDVFPEEPAANLGEFQCPLSGVDNVILTPHIGGSTEEAQRNIGREVASTLINYLDNGSTLGAVNFPNIHLPAFPQAHRILNVHRNQPGALSDINKVISEVGANIEAQYLSTFHDVGYLIMDIDKRLSDEVKEKIGRLERSIKTRILF